MPVELIYRRNAFLRVLSGVGGVLGSLILLGVVGLAGFTLIQLGRTGQLARVESTMWLGAAMLLAVFVYTLFRWRAYLLDLLLPAAWQEGAVGSLTEETRSEGETMVRACYMKLGGEAWEIPKRVFERLRVGDSIRIRTLPRQQSVIEIHRMRHP